MVGNYREDLEELRIYQPPVGQYPGLGRAAYVGKEVHVVWMAPVFSLSGSITVTDKKTKVRRREAIHQARYYDYVVEFDAQVPEEELMHVPKETTK